MHVSMDQEACSHDEVVGANGAVTQKRIVTSDGRKMTVHDLYECRHWRRIRSDITDDVRKYDQITKTNTTVKMLWELCICCHPEV